MKRAKFMEQALMLSREPFREVMAELLEARPTVAQIRKFARERPDKWAHCLSIVGRLSGYGDRVEHEHNFNVRVMQMSDAEVELELRKLSDLAIEGSCEGEVEGGVDVESERGGNRLSGREVVDVEDISGGVAGPVGSDSPNEGAVSEDLDRGGGEGEGVV